MYTLKQSSTEQPLVFLLVESADHITPLTGATPTVTLSKNGGSFASSSGSVSEIANGWYKVAGNATDTGTLGPLILHATASSGDPTDVVFDVVIYDPQAATNLGLTALPAVAASSAGGLLTIGTGSGQINPDGSGNVPMAMSQALPGSPSASTTGSALVAANTLTFNGSNVKADVTQWLGTAVTAATSGIPDVNIKNINNTAASTPGASGGLLISGSNSGTTTFGAFTITGNFDIAGGCTITQSTSNGHGLSITGNGTGHGIYAISGGGATGDGIHGVAASTNGNGISAAGVGTGSGVICSGGATGYGAYFKGGATSGHGAYFYSPTSGNGIAIQSTASGHDINLIGDGILDGSLSGSVNSVTTQVTANVTDINSVSCSSVSTINANIGTVQAITFDTNNSPNVSAKYWAGSAITATSIPVSTAAGAHNGLMICGTNTGPWSVSGGVTYSNSGGDAFFCNSTGGNGNGINAAGNGTGNGYYGQGGSGVSGDGMHLVGGNGTSNYGLRAVGGGGNGSYGIYGVGAGTGGYGIAAQGSLGSHDIGLVGDGVFYGDIYGKLLGNVVSGNSITGIGAQTDTIQVNGVSTSSVTTINANIGTTSPVTFDSNGYIKVDLVDIAGTAVSTSSAQLGVNVVNFGGSAGTFNSGIPTTTFNNTSIGTVTGSVGSISGITFPTHFNILSIDGSGDVTFNNSSIGTVTNLTNAPTSGDFTSTMKTSLNAATPALSSVGNNAVADALLGRNINGGSSTGRTVSEALAVLRNKVSITGTSMTVYSTDDSTISWATNLTTDNSALPITASAPTS